jgi:light-regulated signal transduction histidine kinase (bacteriophytochrome)
MRREPVDLTETAAGVISELRHRFPDRQVRTTIAPGLATQGDARMVRVLMQNLLENAWKYSSRTDGARIEVFAVPCGDTVAYSVRDNGAGFDMAYANKLFKPFQRLHADGDFEGTGIGLATVQRIVRRHGGRVWAESQVGSGATFTFTLEPEGNGNGATSHSAG